MNRYEIVIGKKPEEITEEEAIRDLYEAGIVLISDRIGKEAEINRAIRLFPEYPCTVTCEGDEGDFIAFAPLVGSIYSVRCYEQNIDISVLTSKTPIKSFTNIRIKVWSEDCIYEIFIQNFECSQFSDYLKKIDITGILIHTKER